MMGQARRGFGSALIGGLVVVAVVLGALTGCQGLSPRLMEPPIWEPLEEPLLEGTLGVRTLEEARPGAELGDRMINHWISLEDFAPESRYWQFHEGTWGNLGASSDKAIGGIRARYTGLASFEWIPFPWVGTVVSRPLPAPEGVSDYLAAILDRRRLARRVVRLPGHESGAGVDYLLEGRLEHFVGILAEAEPTADLHLHPGSDLLLAGRSTVTLSLRDAHTGEELWSGSFDAHDDLVTIDEPIASNVPTDYDRTFTVFSDHFDRWALEAIQERVERSLVDLCRQIVEDVETVLTPAEPEVPVPDVFSLPEIDVGVMPPAPATGGAEGAAEGSADTLFGHKIEIPPEALESERSGEASGPGKEGETGDEPGRRKEGAGDENSGVGGGAAGAGEKGGSQETRGEPAGRPMDPKRSGSGAEDPPAVPGKKSG